MSGGWKDIAKNGWHPEKSGGGSSLRSQVKGLIGRGETPSDRENHVAAPISSLRDPSSFGPPPKHVAAYGATPAQTNSPTGTTSSYTPAPNSSHTAVPTENHTYSATQPYQAHEGQHVQEEAPSEPKPYRFNTTGLSTSHLPPPPTRYSGGADGRTPQLPPANPPTPTATTQAVAPAKPKAPPSLPPRLPTRSETSTPSPAIASGQAASQGHRNQGAINRLGAAGISVPEFGIGGGRTPPPPPGARLPPPSTGSPTQAPGYGQVDELQARFARMGASSSFQASPNGIAADRSQQRSVGQVPSVLGKKKPPPPPSKKPELSGTREGADAPPPIPLATRPRFD
ncbi:hypothetical protein E0Z10_g1010 [Xylaria hypoxylon]|uniref:Uncharacterized protein n=1 Tax=Xylaria hypoxylon TaxID=37992 RepID=A0A4Z0Z658_9PEZI|nr:hypothetical protein E0Z10_g1010 [Xylaria hypoxylon]